MRRGNVCCFLTAFTNSLTKTGKAQAPDLSAASKSAGAYFSSWGTWASEKRKGWGNKTPSNSPGPLSPDLKRAEEWRREKAMVVGDEDEGKSSVFFDAEGKEDKDKKEEGIGKI
jgi:hypothetical protein